MICLLKTGISYFCMIVFEMLYGSGCSVSFCLQGEIHFLSVDFFSSFVNYKKIAK